MALTPRLELRQTQTLVMTPQLQQAIKLLQLSNLELTAYVERELEQNPLLERADSDDAGDTESQAGTADTPGEAAAEDSARAGRSTSSLDDDYDNLWSSDGPAEPYDSGVYTPWRISDGAADTTAIVEQTAARGASLRDELLNQLNVDVLDPTDRIIGVHLVDMLDEAGYISDDLTPVASQLGCELARVEATLSKLQRFDPPGVFARNLRECLALQLRERNRLDAAMETLLDNLDVLADYDLEEARRRCGVAAETFAHMLAELRSLNPKPGLDYEGELAQSVVPDVLVRQSPDGDWLVELNNDSLPRVLVNRRYYAKVSRQAKTKRDREYLADCLTSANWLMRSLDQRANTILRVATELVRRQEGFLAHGVEHLRPLILRDIAAAIDMHESTISRVTANKFMATPRGIFELRYFFTTAIPSMAAGGEAHSSEAVRHRIKTLIAGEDPADPLSDDRLVAILKKEGIDIARRTVAKYREAMHIASSLQRRRRKRGYG